MNRIRVTLCLTPRTQWADALKNAGFDIIQTANNHTMDSKAKGAVRTYNVLREKGLSPVGTAATPEDRKPLIVEKNGIKLAFLAYTYGQTAYPSRKTSRTWLTSSMKT